ncbi:KedN5 family methylcobalamin-dependent radical SAM C-methyltransferase [Amycolatopsis sp. WGS_07]|uniref:KedN5 family methylcobalamin-dependent radical SAM C-methyltransferase n=1 Tax=Amycolatopsis sp. WGS_07 TaxID=3076764 RepID=UPI003873159F
MADGGLLSVQIVQQGIWDLPLESMPLAAGYLKAAALADPRVREHAEIRIRNFRGGDNLIRMAEELFSGQPPDVLAFSVLGWNFREFGALAETFKQVNPEGWVVFGGTHVANQAARVFRRCPEVDVVVNGEGEFVFRDLVNAVLDGASRHDLAGIPGISYVRPDGTHHTTEPRDRIDDLDVIPSPVLTGAIDLLDADGKFRYDVALMETNRGCPYKCSFCYWGGAVGQRVRAFSRERLRAELEVFARHQVHTIVLCDANFGMLPIDREFVDDVIDVRNRYGYPQALDTSWAKNKSAVFYDIVRKMKAAGLRSSFTLALQSLNDDALRTMERRNMKVNDWEDLTVWLDQEGLDCYAELIWGAPGETVQSFMEGYDRLSRHVSRIAVYPLHLLPNTGYLEKKSEYGIVTIRGDHDDFEYILSHQTMTLEENRTVKRFLFWTRVMAENAVFRQVWVGLRELTSLTQSQVLRRLDSWIAETDDPAAAPLRACVDKASTDDTGYGDATGYLCGDNAAARLLVRWWRESIEPLLPADRAHLLSEILRYDLATLPFYRHPGALEEPERLPRRSLPSGEYYVREHVAFDYDIPALVAGLRAGEPVDTRPRPAVFDLCYRAGAENFVGSTNHEQFLYFVGVPESEIVQAVPLSGDGAATT